MERGTEVAARTKADVLLTIADEGVVPVFSNPDVDIAADVAAALVAGGFTTLEFTNRGDGAIGVMESLIRHTRRHLPELIVGAGSIVDGATAAHVVDIGANFVFGPSFSADVSATSATFPMSPAAGQ